MNIKILKFLNVVWYTGSRKLHKTMSYFMRQEAFVQNENMMNPDVNVFTNP